MRKLLGTLALIAFGFGLALVVADLGIRVANRWFPYFYCYDQYRGWGLNAGAHGWYRREGESYVRINHDGFRGPDYPRPKPAGTVRIAVIGDSYVEAIQVAEDQTFTAVAGRELAQCPALKGKRVEALNFGVDGYGTAQELITLQRKVWNYDPDFVVLAIFLGNDVRNNSVVLEGDQCRPFWTDDGGAMKLTGPFIDSPSFKLWCMARFDYRDLRLLDLFSNTWEIVKGGAGAPTAEHPVERAINYSIYSPPVGKAWQDAWRITEKLIAATHDAAARHHVAFLAVTEETGIQAWPDPAVRAKFIARLGVPDLFYPDRRIAALGKRDGFAVLNLAQPLQQYAQRTHLFLHGFKNTPRGFGHWNANGHAIAGRLIGNQLCAMIAAGACTTCGALPIENIPGVTNQPAATNSPAAAH
ncbi:MAG TPA: SGNH/GDSL hydrolase family protein [Candidatus Binataceae bacterium]|nr:SGNH/GDSL hydrolase family protein [Candidatus Binataceae bacterium]